MKEFAILYCIGGLLTCSIGICRSFMKNKQPIEPDELTLMSWFLLWWMWLPYLIIRWLYFFIFKGKSI
jgi:hypothetical protein